MVTQAALQIETGAGFNRANGSHLEVGTTEGLGFRTAEAFLRFIRNHSEEALRPRKPLSKRKETSVTDDSAAFLDTAVAAEADEVVLGLVNAWNHHDLGAWSACFTEDADYVNVDGMHWHGRDEIEAKSRELPRSILKIKEWTIRPVAPQVAVVHLNWKMKREDRETRRGILTLVVVRRSDRWLISAAHNNG